MTKTLLTSAEIDLFCVDLLTQNKSIYVYLYPLFSLQYETGCRIGETLDVSRWTELTKTWKLVTEKTGAVRTISKVGLSVEVQAYLRADQRNYPSDFYSRCRYAFGKLRPYLVEYDSGQDCRTHIFRHNYARQIVAGGGTIKDIEKDLRVSNSVATRYATEDLYRVNL